MLNFEKRLAILAVATCMMLMMACENSDEETDTTEERASATTAPSSAAATDEPTEVVGEWIALFNGVNLDGWSPKFTGYPAGENVRDTFRVEDGILKVAYDNWTNFEGTFGHLFCETEFAHYRFRMDYRFVGEQIAGGPGWGWRNSGVMVHGQPLETMGIDQQFPVSIEVQLLGGDGENERHTGNLCTPGTHVMMNDELVVRHCIDSTSKTFHGEEWVQIEIEVHGNESIKHFINGELVLEYQHPQLDDTSEDVKALLAAQEQNSLLLERGSISLQAESHGVEFRNIEIMAIDPS